MAIGRCLAMAAVGAVAALAVGGCAWNRNLIYYEEPDYQFYDGTEGELTSVLLGLGYIGADTVTELDKTTPAKPGFPPRRLTVTRKESSSAVLWGLPFFGRTTQVERLCTDLAPQSVLIPRQRTFSKLESSRQASLCGLLFLRDRMTFQEWRVPLEGEGPSAADLTPVNLIVSEGRSLIAAPLGTYVSSTWDDGSFSNCVLFGLLYRHDYSVPKAGAEARRVLWWLYRSDRHPNGSIERFLLPGFTLSTHERNDDWAFSLFGGFVGVSSVAGERDWRFLWFL